MAWVVALVVPPVIAAVAEPFRASLGLTGFLFCALPVVVEIADERYPSSVELAAYFVTAETLTNVAKYARASKARVTSTRTASHLVLTVIDDGIGGAQPSAGSGLAGLADRIETLGGTLTLSSRPGDGTHVRAEIPLSMGIEATEL